MSSGEYLAFSATSATKLSGLRANFMAASLEVKT